MNNLIKIKRALISVSDKTGLDRLASDLVNTHGVTLLSTGGTASYIRNLGLPVTDVADVTGFPEMMDGRVKTLHPKIHGGLLALRDDEAHARSMREHDIHPIDLVVINLYPFAATVARTGVTLDEAIENIDIGGPGMVRSAAKNHRFVTVVTDTNQYDHVVARLAETAGHSDEALRRELALAAFAMTASYDKQIAQYLTEQNFADRTVGQAVPSGGGASTPTTAGTAADELPEKIELNLVRLRPLRYGENPHQSAALYAPVDTRPRGVQTLSTATQLHGKELSYINLLDADAALRCVYDFTTPAAVIVKHATPCGVGTGESVATAFTRAYASDAVAAFGGIVAVNRPVDVTCANSIIDGEKFLEVIVAPAFETAALELLKSRWKNCRLLSVARPVERAADGATASTDKASSGRRPYGDSSDGTSSGGNSSILDGLSLATIDGGYLVQQVDEESPDEASWRVVSSRQPTADESADLRIAWAACRHVKSNAIVIAAGSATVGIGGGQVDRVGAAGIAIAKAGKRAKGAAAASDAFFPFPDGPKLLIDAGVTAIIQPGGSVRDQQTVELIDEHRATMIFTGKRHFRH